MDLDAEIDPIAAATGFSGVVRVDDGDGPVLARAYGLADRAHEIANTVDTRFGTASGGKTLTALMVMRLVEAGALTLDTTARSLLGPDLPLIADDVTVEHLLAHRSGIGDYLDEEEIDDFTQYVLTQPVHTLVETSDFLPELDGHPTVFPAGERFAYCNGGYMVLALLAERATGERYHDLMGDLVIEPAGMAATAFLRSDELPGDAAIGYLHPTDHADRLRTNVFHLPVRGNGDGGVFTSVADVHALWAALFAGRVVSADSLAAMIHPHSDVPEEGMRYGMGFWLHATGPAVIIIGGDAGVWFRSVHDPERAVTYTVVSNTTSGPWPIAARLEELLDLGASPPA